jgi:hypothetical protein
MFTLTNDGFLEVDITPKMLANAATKAREMGVLNNSIRKGEGNLVGFLGEEVVLAAWEESQSCNTYQHDITFEEVSFEVKSKDRTVFPRLSYECSVANYNTKQRADFYVFTSIYRPNRDLKDVYTKGHIIGVISKQDYFEQANFLKAGTIDPSNNWKVSADCFNLPYQALSRFQNWRQNSVSPT